MKAIKKTINTIALLLLCYTTFSQNLVPNPSFEDYNICPNNLGQITYATGWSSSRQTPDYFNSCATPPSVSTPSHVFGYQVPASGNAYAGIIARFNFNDNNRESIETKLIDTLVTGTKYYMSFKVSFASGNTPSNHCSINKLGALFSTIHYTETAPAPLCNNCAKVYTDSIISDTLNWTRIKGSFVADSNYSYLNIGRFNYNAMTDSLGIGGNGCNSYYFIDDIAVSTDSIYVFNYNYISTETQESNTKESFKCFPNPVQEMLTIQDPTGYIEDLKIFNIMGEGVKAYSIPNEHTYTVNLNDLKQGIYYITINRKNLPSIKKTIIKL